MSAYDLPDDELICSVLGQTLPLQCDVVGRQTVADIVRGTQFTSFDGGRHLTLGDSIALLSCAAAIVQCLLALRPSTQINVSLAPEPVDPERIAGAIHQLATRSPSIAELLRSEADLAQRLMDALAERGVIVRRQPPPADATTAE